VTSPAGEQRERLGAIDVGSNSIRLLVAEYDPATGLTPVDEVKDQPRLAAGLASTGRLDPAAIDRAILALRRMADVCQRRGARRISAVATAAVREAENGEEFVQRVRAEVGLPLRIIDADTEAQLSYRSVAHHFRLADTKTLIADIGGGSLELVGAVDGLVELSRSLPFGAVRLTEIFLADARNQRKALGELRKHLRKRLLRALPRTQWVGARIIGSGGTFTNLGRMVMARRGLSPADAVHGQDVSTAEVEQLLEWLGTKTPEERSAVPGLSPQRADIILAGLAVTAALLERLEAPGLTISAFGLREGLLLEMVGDVPAPVAPDPMRLVREFAERCKTDRRHVEHVRVLALSLFAKLGDELGCGPEERWLLEAASLLHDVGQLVSYQRHHKHSYQLIMHADRLGLGARERTLVALISRYHRRRGPRKKHPEFAALSGPDQAIVRRVSGLLRVADGLDRGHTAIVESVRVALTDDKLVLHVVPRLAGADLSLECWAAERKGNVLAKLLDREIEIRQGLRMGRKRKGTPEESPASRLEPVPNGRSRRGRIPRDA